MLIKRETMLQRRTDMHKSQLAGLIIDCQTDDVDEAAAFWSAALGLEIEAEKDPEEAHSRGLKTQPDDVYIAAQKVSHPSRVHLDIETDNIEAEVERLQSLGAKRVSEIRRWVVMEAPTGHRFCVVKPNRSNFDDEANVW
jgi:predicted enzyme related to lactoylglutathione lyase